VITLGKTAPVEVIGAKAFNLTRLIGAGFPVPPGWVAEAGRPLAEIAAELEQVPPGSYAVRSSARQEDLSNLSFAGQYDTVLNVEPAGLADAVRRCLDSADASSVAAYRANSGLSADAMAVIVQRMIDPVYAGVAFTVDPVTGADTHLVIEYAPGLGDALVNGQIEPETARFDWDRQVWLDVPESGRGVNGAADWLRELAGMCVAAQQLFGFPLDIEFAVDTDQVWLLQARPVTRIGHAGLTDLWTTADFRDGGVSAGPCKPYMWSLYEYIWEDSFKSFLLSSRLIEPGRLRKLGKMMYGRPYWNLGVAKEVLARTPGYRERDFDLEFGIPLTYDGNGAETKLTAKTAMYMVPVALAQTRLLRQREAEAGALVARIRETARRRGEELHGLSGGPLERAFVQVTRDDYLFSESAYFTQIFLNTIHQSMFHDFVRPHVTDAEYMELLCGLDDVSHLRPVLDLWQISRGALGETEQKVALIRHLAEFGYHSDKELDVSYPNYWEQPEAVAEQLAAMAGLDDARDPAAAVAAQRGVHAARMETLRATLPARRYAKLERKVNRVRKLLWWREEFRDASTMMYDVIRQYTLALARHLCDSGTLDEIDDIWFVPVTDLWALLRRDRLELRSVVARHRRYFDAYRNYLSDNELMPAGASRVRAAEPVADGCLTGIGASPGQVRGTARVIESLEDISRLAEGDILVTRFTDTGWTAAFARLSGVVTEYGGMLCHSAIVSREYGIPCVVGVTGVLGHVRDGQVLEVDGATGEVRSA